MTGYTGTLIENNLDFNAWVMLCARAMGACITLRDEPMLAPIPDRFEPDKYLTDSIAKAKEKLASLLAMNESQKLAYGESRKMAEIDRLTAISTKDNAETEVLQATLRRTKSWKPPTEEHAGLKKFMIEQLEMSIEHQATDYYAEAIGRAKAKSSLDFWYDDFELETAHVINRQKDLVEETERAEKRTKWIADLRSSLVCDDIKITLVRMRGDKCRIGIEAPVDVKVLRDKLFEAFKREEVK